MTGTLEFYDYIGLAWFSMIYFIIICLYVQVPLHFNSVQFCEFLWLEPLRVGSFFRMLVFVVVRNEIKIFQLRLLACQIVTDFSLLIVNCAAL